MKILVTGGTGFIGTAVVNRMKEEGHEVKVFDINLGDDVRELSQCDDAVRGTDVVIHLAGILGTDELFDTPKDAIDINITGSVNMMISCVSHGAKFIPITMLPVFPSIYTGTKVSSGYFAKAYHHTYGLPVTYVQTFNAYGPNQAHGPGHPRKIIPAFSVEGWSNTPLKIWGDGEQMVDLVYVDDVASVFVDALSAPGKCETLDAGTGHAVTVNEVANFVLEVTGSTAGVEYFPMRRGETPTKVVSMKEGWDYLSYKPTYDLLKLMKTITAYRDMV